MTPTQRQAIEMALEALETAYLNDPRNSDGYYKEAMQALRAALAERTPLFKPLIDQLPGLAEELAEQADDKTDMTIKLPPMPEPHTPPTFATAANTPSVKAGYELGGYEKTPPLFDEHQMEAYAREAVRLNMAPLSDREAYERAYNAGFVKASRINRAGIERLREYVNAAHWWAEAHENELKEAADTRDKARGRMIDAEASLLLSGHVFARPNTGNEPPAVGSITELG